MSSKNLLTTLHRQKSINMSSPKPVIQSRSHFGSPRTHDVTDQTKNQFVKTVNQFYEGNDFSISRGRLLKSWENSTLRAVFKRLTQLHHGSEPFTVQQLSRSINKLSSSPMSSQATTFKTLSLETAIKRISQYIYQRTMGEYRNRVSIKMKSIRQKRRDLETKLQLTRHHPQFQFLSPPRSSRHHDSIENRIMGIENRLGKLPLISRLNYDKERALTQINVSLLR